MKKICNGIKKVFVHIVKHFQIYWYLLTVLLLTIYVYCHRYAVADFTFFSDFDGMNLLFIVWVALIIVPSLGKFEGFGLKMKSPFADLLEKKTDELVTKSSMRTYINQDSINDLERKLATLNEKEADKDVE